jgi:tRNA 2-(methylsulfanyl)-N6-isopentenyladenosine37 hydroxylase
MPWRRGPVKRDRYRPRMLRLASRTEPAWTAHALAHLDEVLLDHAHCEKKAAGAALALLFQYPDQALLQAPLAALAREELAHFEAVLAQLARRGQAFRRQRASPYAGRLRGATAAREPARLVDTLLCAALIEARSCERLGLLGEGIPDPPLAACYRALHAVEARHHALYVELACRIAAREAVAARLQELAEHEARVLAELPALARLHGGACHCVDGLHSLAGARQAPRRLS